MVAWQPPAGARSTDEVIHSRPDRHESLQVSDLQALLCFVDFMGDTYRGRF